MRSNPDGFVTTWRYTASSLWIYVGFALLGPVARAVGDVAQGTAVVRNLMLVVVIAAGCALLAAALAGSHELAFAFETWFDRWRSAGG